MFFFEIVKVTFSVLIIKGIIIDKNFFCTYGNLSLMRNVCFIGSPLLYCTLAKKKPTQTNYSKVGSLFIKEHYPPYPLYNVLFTILYAVLYGVMWTVLHNVLYIVYIINYYTIYCTKHRRPCECVHFNVHSQRGLTERPSLNTLNCTEEWTVK